MKIVCAGFGKTGTKTMAVALSELGYIVFDFMDHFWYHRKEWEKILDSGPGGHINDFKKMYKDVDVVTDAPPLIFWEEIIEAFPDAKIILTTREEKNFYKSMRNQIEVVSKSHVYNLMQCITPTGWQYYQHYKRLGHPYFGLCMSHPFDHKYVKNEILVRKAFRRHQAYCQQNAPKDKLLIYKVNEGWEPLCKFLGKEVPDIPFPHENIAGNILEKLMETHPAMLQMRKEFLISLFVFATLSFFSIYFLLF